MKTSAQITQELLEDLHKRHEVIQDAIILQRRIQETQAELLRLLVDEETVIERFIFDIEEAKDVEHEAREESERLNASRMGFDLQPRNTTEHQETETQHEGTKETLQSRTAKD